MKIFHEGYCAYLNEESRADCPYPDGPAKFAWLAGWWKAKEDEPK